jgi:regulator of sigma E protease
LGTLGSNLLSFNKTRISWSVNKLTWPVGIVKVVQKLREEKKRSPLLWLIGIISLALALFNVLPIPALDGGRLLGVLIQGIGRLKPEKYFNIEGYINLIFFIALMGLWVYIILKDLVRFRDIKIPFLG